MKWTLLLVAVLVGNFTLAVGTVSSDVVSGEDSGSASGSGTGEGGGGATSDTFGNVQTTLFAGNTAEATASGVDATATADAGAGAGLKAQDSITSIGETPEIPGESTDALPPSGTTSTTTTTPTSTTPPPPTTTEPCDRCSQPDFNGFDFQAGKCGCCPWPCCCKCMDVSGGDPGPCRAHLDLVIMLDASSSIGTTEWGLAKQFVYNVVGKFDHIGNSQHVAMVTFSTKARIEWNLDSDVTSDRESLMAGIENLDKTGGFTNTTGAMQTTIDEVFIPPHDDPDRPNIAVLFTDGKANFDKDLIPEVSAELNKKALTLCIGVTSMVNKDELKTICGDRVFTVNDFKELGNILSSVQKVVCPTPEVTEKCFCCCTPEQYFGNVGNMGRFW